MMTINDSLHEIFERMEAHFGPTHWWPGDTPFEIAVGAILTQNTAWSNVEKALTRLKALRWLSPRQIMAAPQESLEMAIRSSGYYRQKTERLKGFCAFLMDNYGGSMARMAKRPTSLLREELLALKGIGPETADDILLYACEKPIFVVDAYTKRIFYRCGFIPEKIRYDALQALIHETFPADTALYKELHALIVMTAKDFCKKMPCCEGCPLALPDHLGKPFPCTRHFTEGDEEAAARRVERDKGRKKP
ncbi:MAG: endonuclease III domain-containing protein [Candidatus Hydrogenedentales bacterium]